MSKYVPSKETPSRYSQPWISQGLKRLSKRKKKSYNRVRTTKKKEDWATYKQLKKDNQRESAEKLNSSHVPTDSEFFSDSLISSAEMSDDCVSKFASLVRARD